LESGAFLSLYGAGYAYDFSGEQPVNFFKFISRTVDGTFYDLFNETTLKRAADAAWEVVASQFANTYLTAWETRSIEGNITSTEDRLHANNLSVLLMTGPLTLATFVTAFLPRVLPEAVVVENPESFGFVAKVLRNSVRLQEDLTSTGSMTAKEMELHLSKAT
jgi:hypothetical protein